MDATLLANNSQHCWMLHVVSVCTSCWMLLDVVACCCAKFETGQTFQPTTPNISFVLWSLKRSATMLDSFAQLFQHCWGHACSLRMVYKDLWVVSFPWCTAGWNIMGKKGGAVVRALAPHQCGPGLNPGVDAICGLSLLLVLSLAPRGFSPGTLGFPLSLKTNTFKFQLDLEHTDTFQRVLMNSLVLRGLIVASVCTPLPIHMQQLPTLMAQQWWGLLLPFACSLRCENRLLRYQFSESPALTW